MNPQTVVFVIHGLFAVLMLGIVVWVHFKPDAHDDTLLEDFMYIERRKRIMGKYVDRRAKRRSPESNGRRKGDQ